MLSVVSDNEWAETLIALAGGNAGNAARHFTKDSYDRGNVALAIIWSRVAYAVDDCPRKTQKREILVPPVPIRYSKRLAHP